MQSHLCRVLLVCFSDVRARLTDTRQIACFPDVAKTAEYGALLTSQMSQKLMFCNVVSLAGQGGDVIYRRPEQPSELGHSAACGDVASAFSLARRASFEFQPSLRFPVGW